MYMLCGIVGVGDEGVRVRAAAGLDARQLHRIVDVGDVEDPHAPEALQVHRTGCARVPQSIRPRLSSTDMNSRFAVHRHVALSAGADERDAQRRVGRVRDVVDLEAVEAADDGVVTGERQVGVDEAEVARRGVERRLARVVVEQLHVAGSPRSTGCSRVPEPTRGSLLGSARDAAPAPARSSCSDGKAR